MSDETETPSTRPRTSRFKEHTNTANSIRPPPEELWKDLAIENLIDQFNEDNKAPPTRKASGTSTTSGARPGVLRGSSNTSSQGTSSANGGRNASTSQPPTPASEGAFGRFQRVFAAVFGGVLGKRKAGNADAERDREQQVLDERKQAAEAAYYEAKDRGLLPTPKIFVRPGLAARSHNCVADAATPNRPPRTPLLRQTPSRKDLHKQNKLSKRVSNLEHKLASARKELQSVLDTNDATIPPVPPLPAFLPPTPPVTSQSDTEPAPQFLARSSPPSPEPSQERHRRRHSSNETAKISKKRKATAQDDLDCDYIPVPTSSDPDIDMDTDIAMSDSGLSNADAPRTIKRVKSTSSRKKTGSRLQKRRSRADAKDRPVTVVPDGVCVPFVPAVPVVSGVAGDMEVDGGDVVVSKTTTTTTTTATTTIKEAKKEQHQENNADGKILREGDDGYGGLEHEMF
ncbi:hypothetical protein ACN47E_003187 [Coniothyrium glycines]